MEPTFSEPKSNHDGLPTTGAFIPSPNTILLAKGLAEALEKKLDEESEKSSKKRKTEGEKQGREGPPVTGVGLFRLDANQCELSAWKPTGKNAVNNGLSGYDRDFSESQEIQMRYCKKLLKESGVFDYFQKKAASLLEYNVIVHLHYYRRRSKPDGGFHKDTRGQTLFFLLHYLNEESIFGPEFTHQRGPLRMLSPETGGFRVQNLGTRKRATLKEGAVCPPEDWEYIRRDRPDEPVWPKVIGDEIVGARNNGDDDIHVMRVEPFGAVLVVDEMINHRTPHPLSRDNWKVVRPTKLLQVSTIVAADAKGNATYYELENGRSRRRSLSVERMNKDSELTSAQRWEATFSRDPRKFFRIWVTVSHIKSKVSY